MAAGYSLTTTIVNNQIAADAVDQKNKYFQWKRWFDYYSENFSSTAQLDAAGVTNSTDQTTFQNFVNDLSKLITRFSGGTPAAQTNYLFDTQMVNAWRHDPNVLKAELAQVANALMDMYYWWLGHFDSWNTNAPMAVLEAAPLSFSTTDAGTITSIVSDMNTLAGEFNDGAPGSAINMLAHCEAVLGVQG